MPFVSEKHDMFICYINKYRDESGYPGDREKEACDSCRASLMLSTTTAAVALRDGLSSALTLYL